MDPVPDDNNLNREMMFCKNCVQPLSAEICVQTFSCQQGIYGMGVQRVSSFYFTIGEMVMGSIWSEIKHLKYFGDVGVYSFFAVLHLYQLLMTL